MKRLVAVVAIVLAAGCGRPVPEAAVEPREEPPMPRKIEKLELVTLGDSLAYGTGDERGGGLASRLADELARRGLANVTTTNLGVNGAQTSDVLRRVKEPRVRQAIASADAIVLSIGANDLFRSPAARDETLRAPIAVAQQILHRIETIIGEIHAINPEAQVLILGGYNPVPSHPLAPMISQYLRMWDQTLAARFEQDHRVAVVPMFDLVTPERLSRYDNFHPGSAAYDELAQRVAEMVVRQATAA